MKEQIGLHLLPLFKCKSLQCRNHHFRESLSEEHHCENNGSRGLRFQDQNLTKNTEIPSLSHCLEPNGDSSSYLPKERLILFVAELCPLMSADFVVNASRVQK